MYRYDNWLLLSCCTVHPLVRSHGQVSETQEAQVAQEKRPAALETASVNWKKQQLTTPVGQHMHVWSSLNVNGAPYAHSRQLIS